VGTPKVALNVALTMLVYVSPICANTPKFSQGLHVPVQSINPFSIIV
jgi:hypothetical protein